MGLCTDTSTTYLNRLGYNVVRHPREGIEPLQLIGRQNGTTGLIGGLSRLLYGEHAGLPLVSADRDAADINGQTTDALEGAVGVSILSGLVQAMGGTAGISAHFQRVTHIQFEFEGVKHKAVEPLAIGGMLKDGHIDAENPLVEPYVRGNGQLFIITETIQSNRFLVTAMGENTAGFVMALPVLRETVGGHVEVTRLGNSTTALRFEGPVPLVFGFKCYRLDLRGRRPLMVMQRPDGAVSFGLQDVLAENGAWIFPANGLLDLQELATGGLVTRGAP